MSAVFRYEVPVDDQWHAIEFDGDIVHVAARDPGYVEFPVFYIDLVLSDTRAGRWLSIAYWRFRDWKDRSA